ncbi:sensor histidine kinase [Clostridium tetani]|uniref:sensor histidine kinase n=1 Tax=Clostridium tetani TaxID=1513 RepID=UPI00051413F7|nr:sensor histidine kinase [Clostridium tetani]AVP54923.1 sensor histidine kinase [Clostridium tetani]KGI37416.1 histidine kinase [Clostridium tetani ATCC 9441]RXI47815.1 sensor histidine kinase [Clostridium tetani]RXI52938.1 sensor histidine kinase [Clostridium tetani]RXI55853.1 sensor histidine kinase [Clostridium tetani]
MNFIDFLKDRIAYIIVYLISISFVILTMHLTLFIKVIDFPITNILYAYFVSIVILIIFLVYEYSKVRAFYKQLYEILNSENIMENIINIGEVRTIEQKLFTQILKKLYKSYEDKVYKYKDIQKHYLDFINQWVHQMKTPVSVIDLILQEEDTSEFNEILDSIGEENEKISQGLNIMLYNARINEFNHDFNVEDIDILLILRKVINDNKKLLIRHKIFPKISGETAIVQTDKKWIYFVINQIVINAIKYTAATEKDKKTINFNIKEDTTKIVVSIEDNGIGIPKEDLGRVFNAFFTGKNGRKTSESTGMGMYLSKRICEELGNEVYVESEEGKGASFYIAFYKSKNIFKL